jgi:hypothetical protein
MNSLKFFACIPLLVGMLIGSLAATPIPSQAPKYPKAKYPRAKHQKADYPSPKPTPTRRVPNGSRHSQVVLHVNPSHSVKRDKTLPLAVSHASVDAAAGEPSGEAPENSSPGVTLDLPAGN